MGSCCKRAYVPKEYNAHEREPPPIIDAKSAAEVYKMYFKENANQQNNPRRRVRFKTKQSESRS